MQVMLDIEEDEPIRFNMAAEGTFRSVDPSGNDRILRRWFSY